MITFDNLVQGSLLWKIETTGDINKGNLHVRFDIYTVTGVEVKNNIIYIRTFSDELLQGYLIYLPVVEKNMYWTECNGVWTADRDNYMVRMSHLLKEAGDRYASYIYADEQSLERIQDTVENFFQNQDVYKDYDKYFTHLLEIGSSLVPVTYKQVKSAIYLHNTILNNIKELYDRYKPTGPHEIDEETRQIMENISEKTAEQIEEYKSHRNLDLLC